MPLDITQMGAVADQYESKIIKDLCTRHDSWSSLVQEFRKHNYHLGFHSGTLGRLAFMVASEKGDFSLTLSGGGSAGGIEVEPTPEQKRDIQTEIERAGPGGMVKVPEGATLQQVAAQVKENEAVKAGQATPLKDMPLRVDNHPILPQSEPPHLHPEEKAPHQGDPTNRDPKKDTPESSSKAVPANPSKPKSPFNFD